MITLCMLTPTLLSCTQEQADTTDTVLLDSTTAPPIDDTSAPADTATDIVGTDKVPDDTTSVDISGSIPEIKFPDPAPSSEAMYFYVSARNGNDSASGKSADYAVKSLKQAYTLAERSTAESARIIITDTYTITETFLEPAHKKHVTLSADGGKIVMSGNYRFQLSGNTTFENITVEFPGTVNFVANYNYITFGENVTLRKTGNGNGAYVVGGYQSPAAGIDVSKNSHIKINSGEFWAVIGGTRQVASGGGNMSFTGYQYIEVNGGSITTLYGGTTSNHTAKNCYIKVNGGYIEQLCAAGEATRSLSGDAMIELSGGKVDMLNVNNVYGDATVILGGTDLRVSNVSYYDLDIRAKAEEAGGAKLFVYANEKMSDTEVLGYSEKFSAAVPYSIYIAETPESENVLYVADGGKGNGLTASEPTTLSKALRQVDNGGVIVIVGLTNASAITYSNKGKLTFTSKYGGVDYTRTSDAALVFSTDFTLGGETLFEHIEIHSTQSYKSIFANNHPVTIGEGVVSLATGADANHISLMGGSKNAYTDAQSSVIINSGTWQRVRGGTAANGSKNYNVSLTINGGRFNETVTLASSSSHNGAVNAAINGGVFFGGIQATGISKENHTFDASVELKLNGGIFYQSIAVSSSGTGTYSGTYTVMLNGGEFAHLIKLTGTEGLSGGMTSTLTAAIDMNEKETGVYNFSNPVRDDGADPWIFYNNGYYYYIATVGSLLRLRRAANIGDLPYAEAKVIYDPEDGHEWSKNLWSPEIHYYTDEQIGEGNGGWYCYIACDDGDNKKHRMYVIKCLDGNDLYGRWGNPVTGEVNVPQKIIAEDIPNFDDTWAAGQTDILINGQLYMMYVTEAGRGTVDMHQTINLVKMTNPWTITGKSSIICKSEYDWEMHGHAVSQTTGKVWPKVVEGGTAVYGDNGEVYIIYSGSGYWTTYYSLGQLKYMGGDPLDINNWKKSPEPIFTKNGQINGCGHASYVTDTSGQRWICYHAYTGKNTDSGRDAFVEPYSVDTNGVTVGNGSTHPADLATVYTADLNPMPLAEKTSAFTSVN